MYNNQTTLGSKSSRQANRDRRQGERDDRRASGKVSSRGVVLKGFKPFQKLKTLIGAGPRSAFLGLVALNAIGLASLLNLKNNPKISQARRNAAKIKYDEIALKFYKLGGNRTTLQRTVINGSKRKALGSNLPILKNLGFVKGLKSAGVITGLHDTSTDIGLGAAGELAASITAALPILTEIAEALSALVAMLPKRNDQGYEDYSDEDTSSEDEDTSSEDEDTSSDGSEMMKNAGGALVGVAILAALYFGTKKK